MSGYSHGSMMYRPCACQGVVWQKPEKVATASSFTIVYEKSEGKSIEHSIAKTFLRRNNSPCSKYVIYFSSVTYFIPAILYLLARFLRISNNKIS